MTVAHNSPSLLPRVLMFATIGLSSQTAAKQRARSWFRPLRFSTRIISHPATRSEVAKIALPKWNHSPPHVEGSRIHASKGVYLYVALS